VYPYLFFDLCFDLRAEPALISVLFDFWRRVPVPKLLLMRTTDYFAAVERMLLAWAVHRQAKGWQVQIVLLFRQQNEATHPFIMAARAASVPVIPIRERSILDFHSLMTIRKIYRAWQPDVSHSQDYKTDLILQLLGRGKRFASVHGYTDHNYRARLWRILDRRALRRMDGIIVPSAAVAADLDMASPPLFILINGLEVTTWREAAKTKWPAAARRWARQPGPKWLFLGRCSVEKGGDLLLKALGRLRREGKHPVLLLAGDGPACGDWQALASGLGLSEQITFAGWIDRPAPLLAAADLLLMPSRREAFGMAALEAAVLGTPVVAAGVGGLVSLVKEYRLGRILPPGDVEAWADALGTLWVAPADLPRLPPAVVAVVAERFSMENWLSGMDAAYREWFGA